uniref:Uncharacterized protein n=1 Tax=Labrus bergylta TaxID=56723 RepID=A0A3Q3EK86_9LABR
MIDSFLFCVLPKYTCFPSSDRMRNGFAVSGSRVMSTAYSVRKKNSPPVQCVTITNKPYFVFLNQAVNMLISAVKTNVFLI